MLFATAAHAAVYNWSSTCTQWHFNPDNSKQTVIVFNTTVYPQGICPGFDGSAYAFAPCNFPMDTWVQIPLAQFGIGPGVKEIYVEGEMIITPTNVTADTPEVAINFRAPGSSLVGPAWLGYNIGSSGAYPVGSRSVFASMVPVANQAVEAYWVGCSVNQSGVCGPGAPGEYFGINLSLQGWCE